MALITLQGTPAAPGIGIGRAHIHDETAAAGPVEGHDSPSPLSASERGREIERLRQAREAAAAQLEQLSAGVRVRIGATEAAVFEAQALFLQDPSLVEPMEAAIRNDGQSALDALERVMEAAARELEAVDDPYLSARAADLRDVKGRVASLLAAPGPDSIDRGRRSLEALSPGTILFARDLTPSDTVGLRPENVGGIVLAEGGPTAHAAILARALGLPLVVAVGAAIRQVTPGQDVILDGADGSVLVEPQADEREEYRRRIAEQQIVGETRRREVSLPAQTEDGRRLELFANVSSVVEARLAVENGAEGVGLLRTEFLLASLCGRGAAPPDEEELAEAYGAIFAVMGDRPIVVRAMDAGGDKPLPFVDFGREANPFLGWRGIRVLLDRPELFASQTRALLRAAARHGTDLRLMFPMVSDVIELIRARRLVGTVCREQKIELAHPLKIGVMVEVPAAAMVADALAREADFFSLGTNDLTQYTLACDRGNPRVGQMCQVVHPAVLRLIDLVVRAASPSGCKIGVCGEAAADPVAIPLLLGLGVDEFSVGPAALPDVRRCVRGLSYRELQALAAQALTKATAEQVTDLLAERMGLSPV